MRLREVDMGGVLIIDDDDDLRDALGELTAKLRRQPGVVVGSLGELAELEARALECSLAIIDINLGPGVPNGIDVYDWLRARRFAGRIVFLSGHGPSHPLVERASTLANAHVVRKPMSDEELRELVGLPVRVATFASRR
jgi:FixJ family two-component response regulator